jgi:plasmid stabilization system protein ParE
MMPVRLVAEARPELREAVEYYEDQRDGLGVEFVAEFKEAVRAIQRFPEGWAKVSAKSRRRMLNRFPYGLIYQVLEEQGEIVILAVMHLRREPEYWTEREQ